MRIAPAITVILVLVGAAGVGWLYAQCADERTCGFLHDDGVYVITARALAQGDGYVLSHLPGEPEQTRYPIAYPILLAAAWAIWPSFPENIVLMKGVTIGCFCLSLIVLFHYLRCTRSLPRWLAAWITIAVAISPVGIDFLTFLMSESLYILLSLLALSVAERRLPGGGMRSIVLVAVLAAAAFHARTIGIVLIGAIGLWLLLERRGRHAVVYGAVSAALTVVPWLLWSMGRGIDPADPVLQSTYYSYAGRFASADFDVASVLAKGAIALSMSLQHLVLPGLVGAVQDGAPAVLLSAAVLLSGMLVVRGAIGLRRRDWSIAGLYVTAYVIILLVWGFHRSADRFMLPILPLLLLFMLQTIVATPRVWLRATLLVTLGVLQVGASPAAFAKLSAERADQIVTGFHAPLWPEYESAFAYVRGELPRDARIATAWEAIFALYTDRPTYPLSVLGMSPDEHGGGSVAPLWNGIEQHGVRYLVIEPDPRYRDGRPVPNEPAIALTSGSPERFRPVFRSPNGFVHILEIMPSASVPESARAAASRLVP